MDGCLFVGSTFSCSESIGNLNSLVGMSQNITALLNRWLQLWHILEMIECVGKVFDGLVD